MNYRDPVKFMPYNFKWGYFSYGGTDYWDSMLSGESILETSPYILHDQDFPNIDDVVSVIKPILRHRIIPNFNAEADGLKVDDILIQLLEHLPE